MIKKIIYFILFACLCSCSAGWHIKKALKKDPSIQKEVSITDTITLTRYSLDTIRTSDSTYYVQITETKYDSVISYHYQKYDFSEMKTWFQALQENKTERSKIRNAARVDKTTVKQENKTERNKDKQERKAKTNTWMWLSILLVAFIVVYFGLKWLKSTARI